MARAYTTIARVQNYLLVTIEASFVAQITEWIEVMSEYIEGETSKVFEADALASAKKYEIKQKETDDIGKYVGAVRSLQIDDAVEVDSVSIDDEAVDVGDYLLYPANSLPKTRITLKEDSGLLFTEGEQNIEVSAKWGYSETPPGDIIFACTVLVAGIINNSWSSEGEVKSVSMGAYNLTFKDEKQLTDFDRVEEILAGYQKIDV